MKTSLVCTLLLLLPLQVHAAENGEQTQPPAQADSPTQGDKLMCRMLMQSQVSPYDPTSLLAVADQLQLTQEQQDQLQAMNKDIRQQAQELLTQEQQQRLQEAPQEPMTCMRMHKRMMRMRQGMMHNGKQQGGRRGMRGRNGQRGRMMRHNGMQNCPMMQMMDQESGNASEPPATE